jgi:hypothetical protein
MASIRCLNAAIYTYWCDRRIVPLLGKQIDFASYAKSMSRSSLPTIAARNQLDNRPTRQIIEEAITSLTNENPTSSNIQDLASTIYSAKGCIKEHIDAIGSNINTHTLAKVEAVQAVQQNQHLHMLQQLQLLSTISKEYSNHMSGISTALLQGPLGLPNFQPPGLYNEEVIQISKINMHRSLEP